MRGRNLSPNWGLIWRSGSGDSGGNAASVASGLQRIGRAGHQVGGVSKGLFSSCGMTVDSAVIMQVYVRRQAGKPDNAIIHSTSLRSKPLPPQRWRRDGPPRTPCRTVEDLPRRVFDATLRYASGAIPLAIFCFSPKLVWETGILTARRRSIVGGYQRHHSGSWHVYLLPEGEERPVRGGWVNWMRRWYMSRG